MNKFIVFSLILISISFAEQALNLGPSTVDAAEEKIKSEKSLGFLCKNCEVTTCEVSEVKGIRVLKDGDDYQIEINGVSRDIAYVYFLRDGKWNNLAQSIFYPVEDVPKTLNESECQDKL